MRWTASLAFRVFFFFNDTATTEIYTLSLHDALPISPRRVRVLGYDGALADRPSIQSRRSEEHTSELQSRLHLVCRLLLEKKKKVRRRTHTARQPSYRLVPTRISRPDTDLLTLLLHKL